MSLVIAGLALVLALLAGAGDPGNWGRPHRLSAAPRGDGPDEIALAGTAPPSGPSAAGYAARHPGLV
jgi:hypothetical protein